MFVREKPTAWEVFFVLRGSLVMRIMPRILFIAGMSLIIVLLHRTGLVPLTPVAPLALTVIGAALSIFSAFRNSACYERWWEARKLVGLIVIETRNLARESRSYVLSPGEEVSRRVAMRCVAFIYATRDFLRGLPIADDTAKFIPAEQRAAIMASRNPPNGLLNHFSADIAEMQAAGWISPLMAKVMEERVCSLCVAFASAERTKVTPMPFTYTLLLHRTAYFFCILLPFGIADSAGLWTPFVAAIVCYTFFGLDAIGDEMEAPFGSTGNCLPLDAIARAVEINILESLGETNLPEPLKPKDFVLT